MYVAIMKTDGASCAKLAEFPTLAEADAHVAAHPEYPDAFTAPKPAFPFWRWVCDPVAKSIMDRGPLTQAEADALAAAEDDRLMQRVEIRGIDRAQFAALLDHENRLRVLEGRATITAAGLKDWVKARL